MLHVIDKKCSFLKKKFAYGYSIRVCLSLPILTYRWLVQVYGGVYYRAWRLATGAFVKVRLRGRGRKEIGEEKVTLYISCDSTVYKSPTSVCVCTVWYRWLVTLSRWMHSCKINHLAPLYVCLPILSQECLLYTILVIHCHQNLSAACSIDLMSL